MTARLLLIAALAAVGIAWSGCDDGGGGETDADTDADADTDTDTDSDTDADAGPDGGSDPLSCEDLQEGWNYGLEAGGLMRNFILELPENVDDGGPWPVVFSWHGIYVDTEEYHQKIAPLVDNETMPFIGVTPDDSEYSLMGTITIDWQVESADPEANIEAALFDEILACIEQKWGVDEDRVHSIGMSLGGITTDLLGVIRGDTLASIATYSGAYGSNPAVEDDWPAMLVDIIEWPAMEHDNLYTQLFFYGGEDDIYEWEEAGGMEIPFYLSNPHDSEYLNGLGHDTILCDHGEGHEIPGDAYDGDSIIDFFSKHPMGTHVSPYGTDGLPASLDAYDCSFNVSSLD